MARGVIPPPDGGYPGGNTAEGHNALFGLTTGGYNTSVGFFSLRSNTTNSFNTALGAATLFDNTADENTAVGAAALLSNTIGGNNTATGAFALQSNTTGFNNTATGARALALNTAGFFNVAIGVATLFDNTTGQDNTGVGHEALEVNRTGNGNTALGSAAGSAITTGNNDICIGAGVNGIADENNAIHIGDNLPTGAGQSACYIGGVAGQSVDPTGAGQVYVDNSGKIGVFLSSQRFKRDIRPMEKASEAILALKPVSFHYKTDATKTPCFGLIAEEVAKVDPDLVLRDKEGKPFTVRYDQVNVMLLNEFLKAHSRMQEQQATIAHLEKQIGILNEGLQRVNAEIELRKDKLQVTASVNVSQK